MKSALARKHSPGRLRGPRLRYENENQRVHHKRGSKTVTFDKTDEVIRYEMATPDMSDDNPDKNCDIGAALAVSDPDVNNRPLPHVPAHDEHATSIDSRREILEARFKGSLQDPITEQDLDFDFDSAKSIDNIPQPPVIPATPAEEESDSLNPILDRPSLDQRMDAVLAARSGMSPRVEGSWHKRSESEQSDTESYLAFKLPSDNLDDEYEGPVEYRSSDALARQDSLQESQRHPHTVGNALPAPASEETLQRTYSKRRHQILNMLDPHGAGSDTKSVGFTTIMEEEESPIGEVLEETRASSNEMEQDLSKAELDLPPDLGDDQIELEKCLSEPVMAPLSPEEATEPVQETHEEELLALKVPQPLQIQPGSTESLSVDAVVTEEASTSTFSPVEPTGADHSFSARFDYQDSSFSANSGTDSEARDHLDRQSDVASIDIRENPEAHSNKGEPCNASPSLGASGYTVPPAAESSLRLLAAQLDNSRDQTTNNHASDSSETQFELDSNSQFDSHSQVESIQDQSAPASEFELYKKTLVGASTSNLSLLYTNARAGDLAIDGIIRIDETTRQAILRDDSMISMISARSFPASLRPDQSMMSMRVDFGDDREWLGGMLRTMDSGLRDVDKARFNVVEDTLQNSDLEDEDDCLIETSLNGTMNTMATMKSVNETIGISDEPAALYAAGLSPEIGDLTDGAAIDDTSANYQQGDILDMLKHGEDYSNSDCADSHSVVSDDVSSFSSPEKPVYSPRKPLSGNIQSFGDLDDLVGRETPEIAIPPRSPRRQNRTLGMDQSVLSDYQSGRYDRDAHSDYEVLSAEKYNYLEPEFRSSGWVPSESDSDRDVNDEHHEHSRMMPHTASKKSLHLAVGDGEGKVSPEILNFIYENSPELDPQREKVDTVEENLDIFHQDLLQLDSQVAKPSKYTFVEILDDQVDPVQLTAGSSQGEERPRTEETDNNQELADHEVERAKSEIVPEPTIDEGVSLKELSFGENVASTMQSLISESFSSSAQSRTGYFLRDSGSLVIASADRRRLPQRSSGYEIVPDGEAFTRRSVQYAIPRNRPLPLETVDSLQASLLSGGSRQFAGGNPATSSTSGLSSITETYLTNSHAEAERQDHSEVPRQSSRVLKTIPEALGNHSALPTIPSGILVSDGTNQLSERKPNFQVIEDSNDVVQFTQRPIAKNEAFRELPPSALPNRHASLSLMSVGDTAPNKVDQVVPAVHGSLLAPAMSAQPQSTSGSPPVPDSIPTPVPTPARPQTHVHSTIVMADHKDSDAPLADSARSASTTSIYDSSTNPENMGGESAAQTEPSTHRTVESIDRSVEDSLEKSLRRSLNPLAEISEDATPPSVHQPQIRSQNAVVVDIRKGPLATRSPNQANSAGLETFKFPKSVSFEQTTQYLPAPRIIEENFSHNIDDRIHGLLYFKINHVKLNKVPMGTLVTLSIDNGRHCIESEAIPLADLDRFQQEYRINVQDSSKVTLTVRLSKAKTSKWAKRLSYSRVVVGHGGLFGRCELNDLCALSRGHRADKSLQCMNLWTRGKQTSSATVKTSCLYIPCVFKDEVLPNTLSEALDQISAMRAEIKNANPRAQGVMRQYGGDVQSGKLRWFMLDPVKPVLVACSEATHRARTLINLAKAVSVRDVGNSTFEIRFKNGDNLQFNVRPIEDYAHWVNTISQVIGNHEQNRARWLNCVMYECS